MRLLASEGFRRHQACTGCVKARRPKTDQLRKLEVLCGVGCKGACATLTCMSLLDSSLRVVDDSEQLEKTLPLQ